MILPLSQQQTPNLPPCQGILVIDDEKDIRETIREFLEWEGYPVTIASHGQEGLKILSELALPQLIFLDLMMPVMDGWQFAETVAPDPKLSCCPIVVVSAFSEKARSLPACGLLRKPLNLDDLLRWAKKCMPAVTDGPH